MSTPHITHFNSGVVDFNMWVWCVPDPSPHKV